MTTNQTLIRAKDLSLIITVLTLLGLVIGPMKKIFKLDETITKVEKMEDTVNETTTRVAVITSQYSDINKQLEQINWQLRRMRDDRR